MPKGLTVAVMVTIIGVYAAVHSTDIVLGAVKALTTLQATDPPINTDERGAAFGGALAFSTPTLAVIAGQTGQEKKREELSVHFSAALILLDTKSGEQS